MWLRPNEAAERARCSRDLIDRAIRGGDLPAKKHARGGRGHVLIRVDDIDAWIDGWADA
ncbi:MAG: helix-turn-helix domain-containing protein [Acidimicrobiales bacterium]